MVGIGEGAGGAGVTVIQGPAPDYRSKGPHHRSGGRLSVRIEVGLDRAQVRENLGLLRSDQQLPVVELPGREPEEVEAGLDGDDAGLRVVQHEPPASMETMRVFA